MDRTRDYLLQHQTHPPTDNSGGGLHNDAFNEEVDLMQNQLTVIEASLEQLQTLARCKTLFDDKTREIDLLANRIKNAIQTLTDRVDELERNPLITQATGNNHGHRTIIIGTIRASIMDATKHLTDSLQTRKKTLETIEARRSLYSGGQGGRSALIDLEAQSQDDILDQRAHGQLQVMNPQQVTYHRSRAEAVERVQRMIGEVSSMFTKVAAIVGQQEEMVLRIDATMDDSLLKLRAGHQELLKYFMSIKNQRVLILKLLGMLLCFSVFFIVFLA